MSLEKESILYPVDVPGPSIYQIQEAKKKIKFKDVYILGEGYPQADGYSTGSNPIHLHTLQLKKSLMGLKFVNLKWPKELRSQQTPRYQVILKKV